MALLRLFQAALRKSGFTGRVVATDVSPTAPTSHLADAAWYVPPCNSSDFIRVMLDLCRQEHIRLIVPTIDTELATYAAHRPTFEDAGVTVAVSGPKTIAVCADKGLTHKWLTEHNFNTVRQAPIQDVLDRPETWEFPLIVKPRKGSAGQDVFRVPSHEMLRLAAGTRDDLVVQAVSPGREHTLNVYVDRSGRCRCVVPHIRREIRGGEVSKALTVKHRGLMDYARSVAEALPDAYGPLNIQCFLDASDEIRVIEINARFGGGYPVAQEAGADFPGWLIAEALNRPFEAAFDDWEDNLAMLRYDEAVFVPGSMLLETRDNER